ncbi:MAG: folylpolyglutamate synthase/dihydrofolate synthase family protein [Saprospiraceae bacterium]
MKSNYATTLDFLFEHLPMFQRQGAAAYKKDLGNIQEFCSLLDNPQTYFPSIHVAGTNGKGSVSHMLASILQAAGYRVGLYVSPHYKDFRERIKVNGNYVSESFVVDFVEQMNPAILRIEPSFFEITVAMAFSYFKEQEVDIAIIEVGLGGRLDSTNIINPLLSIITNISYDHMDLLGNTLPEIAFEKAGIIKHKTPVVIGEYQEESAQVFIDQAAKKEANIHFADQHLTCRKTGEIDGYALLEINDETGTHIENLQVQALGDYQTKNVVTVLQSLQLINQLTPFRCNQEQVREGFRNLISSTRFIGRWMQMGEHPKIVFDSGHNEAGIKLAMTQIQKSSFNQLHFVFGMVKDKDPQKILKLLPQDAIYYFAKADIPRGRDASELKEDAAKHGLIGEAYPSVQIAFDAAKSKANADDFVFVGGSIFIVAEVL